MNIASPPIACCVNQLSFFQRTACWDSASQLSAEKAFDDSSLTSTKSRPQQLCLDSDSDQEELTPMVSLLFSLPFLLISFYPSLTLTLLYHLTPLVLTRYVLHTACLLVCVCVCVVREGGGERWDGKYKNHLSPKLLVCPGLCVILVCLVYKHQQKISIIK